MAFFKSDISARMAASQLCLMLAFVFCSPIMARAEEPPNTTQQAADPYAEPEVDIFEPWVGAPEIPVNEIVVPAPPPVAAPSLLERMDGPRDYLSEKIVAFTTGIDQFFGDERYFQETNKSVVQLNLNENIMQGGSHPFTMEGQAKIDLPSAQKRFERFQFVVEYDPEKKSTGEAKKDQPAAPVAAVAPSQYAASLRVEKSDESRWHLSSDAGIKFQLPLDPFARARGSYALQLEEWRLKLSETVFWFNTIGLGETTQFDMERVLSTPVLFRATSTATCMEVPQNCDLRQDLSFYHTLNERSAVVYQASVLGASSPVLQETAYVLLARYRHRLHKKWVFMEISPQLNFPRTDAFRLNASLLLRLEMLFGATD